MGGAGERATRKPHLSARIFLNTNSRSSLSVSARPAYKSPSLVQIARSWPLHGLIRGPRRHEAKTRRVRTPPGQSDHRSPIHANDSIRRPRCLRVSIYFVHVHFISPFNILPPAPLSLMHLRDPLLSTPITHIYRIYIVSFSVCVLPSSNSTLFIMPFCFLVPYSINCFRA